MSAVSLHARPSDSFETKLAHTAAVLTSAAAEYGSRIVQATSLGAEDMVITDVIARGHLPIAIGTLDTGVLHSETLALLARASKRTMACTSKRCSRRAPPCCISSPSMASARCMKASSCAKPAALCASSNR